MAINKVGSKGIEDGSVATVDLAPGSVTNAKLTNSSFTFDGTSISLGGSDSVNLSASWQSVITADGSTGTTAVAGNGYFIDTTSAAHTLTLPASATIGDFIAIKDYAGTFATNNLTIARNGHNIQGNANDSLITTNRASLVLVYVDSTKGWLYWEEHNVADLEAVAFIAATGGTVTESGDFKIHTFTGDGCFVVSCAGGVGPGPSVVDYLVVAGGGGGGHDNGGGGGAGGFRISSGAASGCYTVSPLGSGVCGITVTATTYPITVGAGGSGGTSAPGGTNGSNSVFSTITSAGGGGGACTGKNGGSGGGSCVPGNPAGTGNTPPVSPPQGNDGAARTAGAPSYSGGGGGGAGAAGTSPTGPRAGFGGDGSYSNINPATGVADGPVGGARYYSGGGSGGGQPYVPGNSGVGGAGGGGTSMPSCTKSGTANTGGGAGGGASPATGGAGGKGIVIIRYKFQ